ncbi:MAG TPA: adenylyl-sulfate kinase [Marmoricola sp.]|nr:adenylyl-sulfate kinase [Marmoricola sp.]
MSLPQYCPTPTEADDLELLLSGALSPLRTFGDDPAVTISAPTGGGQVELVDPEGFPLARLEPDGTLTPLAAPVAGAFRRLHLTPAQVASAYPDGLTVPVAAPLTEADVASIDRARQPDQPVVLLALCGHGTPQGVSPVGLLRATLAAADLIDGAVVVAVPLATHADPAVDHRLGELVTQNYATGAILGLTHEGDLPEPVANVVDQDQPDDAHRGLVIFFTGLSGSGKSTLARALHDLLLEAGSRTVTSLDGDVVRRNLSAGLSFSKEDRETNIRRIGWVAAEISRHRGIAICSPIAPFDSTRQQVRDYVAQAGGRFFLVHVATPLEECERRDKKGLYAKARAGQIPEFTGISSPYEAPTDADVVIDTTGRTIEDALSEVIAGLRAIGVDAL